MSIVFQTFIYLSRSTCGKPLVSETVQEGGTQLQKQKFNMWQAVLILWQVATDE